MKQLARLQFLQGNRCFFCRQPIPEGEESVEHLVAKSNGGGNGDDNCVACCKTLNLILGSLSVKEKMQVILNQSGTFRCPKTVMKSTKAPAIVTAPTAEPLPYIITTLQQRGHTRPRSLRTLNNTIATLLPTLNEAERTALIEQMLTTHAIRQENNRILYAGEF